MHDDRSGEADEIHVLATLATFLFVPDSPIPTSPLKCAAFHVALALDIRQFMRGATWGGSASLLIVAWALAPDAQSVPFIYFEFGPSERPC
jgi:hypothetical protein